MGREGDHVLASVLMRIRVDCSEDGRGAWSDPTEHHHHPQELRNAAARGAERSTRVLALTAGRVASPKADPHPLGLIHVQGQLDGDEQQGDNWKRILSISDNIRLFEFLKRKIGAFFNL